MAPSFGSRALACAWTCATIARRHGAQLHGGRTHCSFPSFRVPKPTISGFRPLCLMASLVKEGERKLEKYESLAILAGLAEPS